MRDAKVAEILGVRDEMSRMRDEMSRCVMQKASARDEMSRMRDEMSRMRDAKKLFALFGRFWHCYFRTGMVPSADSALGTIRYRFFPPNLFGISPIPLGSFN